MSKNEFLATLQESLEGNIPREEILQNMTFYRSYFQESGKSEKEVCDELGDPRLIARSIIDSFAASKGPMADYYTEQARSEYSSGVNQETFNNTDTGRTGTGQTKWYDQIFHFLLTAMILIAVVVVAVVVLKIAFAIIIPVAIIMLIVKIVLDLTRRY